jgi:hypothetical protein
VLTIFSGNRLWRGLFCQNDHCRGPKESLPLMAEPEHRKRIVFAWEFTPPVERATDSGLSA